MPGFQRALSGVAFSGPAMWGPGSPESAVGVNWGMSDVHTYGLWVGDAFRDSW